ncbi:acetyl xylan esterase [Coprinopsis cinerea okayama7|uniref:Acetylxylan esterase n=1 Tax=Coprinopsis cinerea (strain Okayama-7 / 130 / ATCC MYA-4618 / FGSC 9003) TaxID=240176 RepID=AXE1_COPC7|nr:acetyl xylan esterase [Coprinopsis cinerea okayama7\|eukprot:XP_001840093.1 acetyl xylan esterase [Coprinopsis cinerea okayama7\
MVFSPRLSAFVALVALTNAATAVPMYGQCGGSGYTGPTQCDPGLVCVKLNDWYSQCQSGGAQPPVTTTSSPPVTVSPPPSTTTVAPPVATGPPAPEIPAGQLTQLRSFGNNPSNISMFVYKPQNVKNRPGLLVALHPCGGTAQQYFSGFPGFRQHADQRGFIVLYGQSPPGSSNCWDIISTASLTREGGDDSTGIASAVKYALQNWNVDPEKVFVTGTSSGAMMTNIMAATYPDLFKAGAVWAGTAVGCLSANTPQFPPDPCQSGTVIRTPQEWGDRVRRAYPGYNGPWPRMQIWHGTNDFALDHKNLAEQMKQWTNVHNISQTPTSTSPSTPRQGWTKQVYGNGLVETFSGQGAGHGLPESGTEVVAMDFFGL